MDSTASSVPAALAGCDLGSLERAILLTVLYADLFEYPLTEDELYRYLAGERAARQEFGDSLRRLTPEYLESEAGYVVRRGRRETIALRRKRQELNERRWLEARRFARWLWHVPFVRLVAVCGSLAVDNSDEKGDIDLFCVSEPRRLWIVQLSAMLLKRVAALRGWRVCPNYFLSRDHLEIEHRNLYTAHEVAQIVPLVGSDTYEAFLETNGWIRRFLPHGGPEDRRRFLDSRRPSPLRRAAERLLGGGRGDAADRLLHRLLLFYYPLRLWRRGWRREEFRKSYRRERQEVMAGGYGPAVQETLTDRARAWLGELPELDRDLGDLFPSKSSASTRADPLFSRLFRERYRSQP